MGWFFHGKEDVMLFIAGMIVGAVLGIAVLVGYRKYKENK